MALFSSLEKLGDINWTSWKGHMKGNLEMCDLCEIVCGQEKRPIEYDVKDVESWLHREKKARIIIKNSLGSRDYNQIEYAWTAAEIWKTLVSLHQKTGAQGRQI